MFKQRLYKTQDHKVISGVCGGFGEYFNIDPNMIRIGCGLLVLLGYRFPILLYFLCMVLLPSKPSSIF